MSLTRSESDAQDLTQYTFYTWAAKGHQLRDIAKVKSWLFTTLHRAFAAARRRQSRFPHDNLEDASEQLPTFCPALADRLDASTGPDRPFLFPPTIKESGFQCPVLPGESATLLEPEEDLEILLRGGLNVPALALFRHNHVRLRIQSAQRFAKSQRLRFFAMDHRDLF